MKRVTIEDVAKKVGVTKGLVSRALTGKYNVSDNMRDEITRTAVAMGYDFSRLRTKRKKRSKCALVMTSEMLLKEDYWRPIIRAITNTLDEEHINLEYFIYNGGKFGEEEISKLKGMDASGYIFMNDNPERLVHACESSNRPVVVIDPRYILSGRHLQIKYSNYSSFYDLTKMLVSYGHKHFCFYGPFGESASFTEREQGFEACIAEHREEGVSADNVIFKNTDGLYADSEHFERLLREKGDITAIVCANDLIAVNAFRSIKKLGKSVPEDYSVVGFDNIYESGEANFDLTTVNVPRVELGEEAAKYLAMHITNKRVKYSQIVIDCEIVLRGSVRRLTEE
ncbi:MAG: LacI family DNA-binding transcriptional regulator [Clostridia bacterium]|nr:LacI family DNA-binding transcriptional regulator [Clostridia bacterium]